MISLNSWGSKHVVRAAGDMMRLADGQVDDVCAFNNPER